MHRFFVKPEAFSDETVTLDGTDVNHIRNVLRMNTGDRILVLDGQGWQYSIQLEEIGRDHVVGRVLDRKEYSSESPVQIWMGQALIKGNRFDNLVRKSVELGVSAIAPLETRRSVARIRPDEAPRKIERWQRIADEASKQCGRTRVPPVQDSILDIQGFVDLVRDCELKLAFWESETRTRLQDIETPQSLKSLAFVAGPEGGWAPEEIDQLQQAGFQTVQLGPRILRADSVSQVILALLQHRWGDL